MSFSPQETGAQTIGTGAVIISAPVLLAPRFPFFCWAFFSLQAVIPETREAEVISANLCLSQFPG